MACLGPRLFNFQLDDLAPVANLGAFRPWATARLIPETVLNWWIDPSKGPIAKT